jgi:zinc transporter ZupT
MEINLAFAMLLTTAAGLSTGIGSTIAFFIRRPRYSYLSFLLGLSAGVMVYISFTELLGTAIAEVGFLQANIAFFVGIAAFALVDILIPHTYDEESADDYRFGGDENNIARSGSARRHRRPPSSAAACSSPSASPSTTSPRAWSPSPRRPPATYRWASPSR